MFSYGNCCRISSIWNREASIDRAPYPFFPKSDPAGHKKSQSSYDECSQSKIKHHYVDHFVLLLLFELSSERCSGNSGFIPECQFDLFCFKSTYAKLSCANDARDLLGCSNSDDRGGHGRIA